MEEFAKEREKLRKTIGEIGGQHNRQYYIVSTIFAILILVLLVLGVALHKIELQISLEIIIMIGIFKILWMFYQVQKSIHFEFWILNSIEFRINEMDIRMKKIESILKQENLKEDISQIKKEVKTTKKSINKF